MTLDTKAIRARAEAVLDKCAPFGCTDGYCVLRGEAKGMHTNGGCRCLNRRTVEPLLGTALGAGMKVLRTDVPTLCSEVEAQAAEIVRLRAALEKYGRHNPSCPTQLGPDVDCTCGLDAALGRSA